MIETIYRIPGAPRTALLGDFHNGDAAAVLASLAARRPDIICIAGDLVYNRKPQGGRLMVEEQENVIPLLCGCASIAPTFMSLGNHESNLTDDDLQLIAETGTVLLDNEWAAHGSIAIGGLTSHYVLDARAFRAAHPDYQEYQEYKDYNDYQAPGGSASSPGNSAAPPRQALKSS